MATWIVPPIAGLIEPALAPEIVADAIGAVELNKGQIRIYLYSEQMPIEPGGRGKANKVVSVKIVGQLVNVADAIAVLANVLTAHAPDLVPGPQPFDGHGPPRLVT
jgi:hypothetical protein